MTKYEQALKSLDKALMREALQERWYELILEARKSKVLSKINRNHVRWSDSKFIHSSTLNFGWVTFRKSLGEASWIEVQLGCVVSLSKYFEVELVRDYTYTEE